MYILVGELSLDPILKKKSPYNLKDVIRDSPECYKKKGDKHISKCTYNITEEDLIIDDLLLGYSTNPVDHVKFYHPGDDEQSFHIVKDDVSRLLPSQFQERKIRFYCRNYDKLDEATKLYNGWKSCLLRQLDWLK